MLSMQEAGHIAWILGKRNPNLYTKERGEVSGAA
jgi:hypothetical protein